MFQKSNGMVGMFTKNKHVEKLHNKHTSVYSSIHSRPKDISVRQQPEPSMHGNYRSTNDMQPHSSSTMSTKPKDNFEVSNKLMKRGNPLEKLPTNGFKKRR